MTEFPTGAYQLEGRTVVVTGAGGGIGHAVALAFAREGARTVALDLNAASVGETAAVIEAEGLQGMSVACDISDPASVEAAQQAVAARWGGADILVNCAAIQRRGPLSVLSAEDWDAAFDVNLKGYFLCSQVFGRAMRARGEGVLVHVSSIQGRMPSLDAGAYSATKAGIIMLSKQIAAEWGPQGIRSNVVLPAWVRTPMSAKMYDQPGFTEMRTAVVPARRIGTPEDIAQAVLFMASPRASYVNGAELLVDGGLSAVMPGQRPREE